MKTAKKILAILLVIATLFSVSAAFALNVSAASSESESNDSYSTADILSVGNTIKGELNSSSDIDYYKFNTSYNGNLTLKFNHTHNSSSAYWIVKTYYYAGGTYNTLTTYYIYLNESEIITLPSIGAVSGGTYYVSVDYGSGSALIGYDYSISVSFSSTSYYEKEMNDSYQSATSFASGSSYSGNMHSSGDIDYFKFVASSNGSLKITFKHPHRSSSAYWVVRTYFYENGTYNSLSTYYMYLNDDELIDLPVIGVVSGGTYYVSVDYGSGSDLIGYDYSISAEFKSSNYYEREMNNSYQTATNVSVASSYGGSLYSSSDIDYYKLTAPSTGKIYVSFSHLYNSSSGYWSVAIYSYSGGAYTKLSSSYIYVNRDSTIDLTPISATANGVYFIVVDYGSSIDGYDYSIMLKSDSVVTQKYTLSYNANGGTVSPSSKTVNAGESVTLPTPTKKATITYKANGGSNAPSSQSVSIKCDGWSTSSTATSGTYACGASYKPSKSTTLYAVWSKTSATLSTSVPTRSGYKFLGWSTSSTATSTDIKAGSKVTLSKDATLYAVWQKDDTTASKPTISTETNNVAVNLNEYVDVQMYCPKNGANVRRTVDCTVSDENIVIAEWQRWDGDYVILRLYGVSAGNTTVRIDLKDTDTKELYDTAKINVKVKDPNASEGYYWWEWVIIIVFFGWIWYI